MKSRGTFRFLTIAFLMASFLFSSTAFSQVIVNSVTTETVVKASANYSTTGATTATSDFTPNTAYNVNCAGTGNIKVKSFTIGTRTFKRTDDLPLIVKIRRNDNANVTDNLPNSDLQKHTFFSDGATVTTTTPKQVNLITSDWTAPDYMEKCISENIVNRGTDNIFANTGGVTFNNIERIDILFPEPVYVAFTDNIGVMVAERGGNDGFKVAAITAIDGNGTPTAYAPNVKVVSTTTWGATATICTVNSSKIFQFLAGDVKPRPLTTTGTQSVKGLFFTCSEFGIAAGTYMYGFSVMGGDVTFANATDLVNWKNTAVFPTNTTEASGNGGMDMVAFPGLFHTLKITGKVWNDINGSANNSFNNIANAGEVGANTQGHLYAILVNSTTSKVIGNAPVNADGTYEFLGIPNNINVSIYLSPTGVADGANAPTASNLPPNWVFTSSNFYSTFNTGVTDITGKDFGVEQLPTSGIATQMPISNPSDNILLNIEDSLYSASDPNNGFISSLRITAFPDSVESMVVEGTTYTAANFPAAGLNVATSANGVPITPIFLDPVDGLFTIHLYYKVKDNAGREQNGTGAIHIPLTVRPTEFFPVTYSSFSVRQGKGRVVILEWTTSSEQNNSHFEVEKSVDGKSFEEIGKVVGKGNSTTLEAYSFNDNSPSTANTNYYRLKQVDIDGNFDYSEIENILIEMSEEISIMVYPNPVKDFLNVKLEGGNGIKHLILVDNSGSYVMDASPANNAYEAQIDMQTLPDGLYFLNVKTANGLQKSEKILKTTQSAKGPKFKDKRSVEDKKIMGDSTLPKVKK